MQTGKFQLLAGFAAALLFGIWTAKPAEANSKKPSGNAQVHKPQGTSNRNTSALRVPPGARINLPNIRWAKDQNPDQKPGGRVFVHSFDDSRDRGMAHSPNIQDHIEALGGLSIIMRGR